nr:hypothetical protein [Polymorphobacter sp.]
MRFINLTIIAAIAAGIPALPAAAKSKQRYEYNGRQYDSYQQCRDEKRRAQKRGTVVGAATAGIGAALLGGNLGESALIAGGGAVVGNQLGKNSKKC